MKIQLSNLTDTLCYEIEGLYYAEEKLSEAIASCYSEASSMELHRLLVNYERESEHRMLRMQRVFNYLMKEPTHRKDTVVNAMIQKTQMLMNSMMTAHMKDIISINCMEVINCYKITSYKIAYQLATELQLDTVCDLLQQSLEEELDVKRHLSLLSITEFNKLATS
jgi:ferritin-like metal-binding protein YciE